MDIKEIIIKFGWNILIWILFIIVAIKWIKSWNQQKSASSKKHSSKKKFNLKFLSKYQATSKEYKSFYIPKRDWTQRLIEAPNDILKNTQKYTKRPK